MKKIILLLVLIFFYVQGFVGGQHFVNELYGYRTIMAPSLNWYIFWAIINLVGGVFVGLVIVYLSENLSKSKKI